MPNQNKDSEIDYNADIPYAENDLIWNRVGEAAEKFYMETAADDTFVRQYRYGIPDAVQENAKKYRGLGPSYLQKAYANLTFNHINMMRAELIGTRPQIQIDPRDQESSDNKNLIALVEMGIISDVADGKRTYASTIETLMEHSYSITRTQEENQWVVQDIFTRGLGWTKETFDFERGLDRSDRIPRHEIFVDPHARTSPRQGSYIVHTVSMPMPVAKRYFNPERIKGFAREGWILKANASLNDNPSLKKNGRAEDKMLMDEKDCFKVQEIWIKDGDKRYLKYRDPINKDIFITLPFWPGTNRLATDDFPFSYCRFYAVGDTFNDSFSELEAIQMLRMAYERLVQFFDDKTFKSLAPLILLDKSLLSEEDIAAIKRGDTYDIRMIDMEQGRSMGDIVKLVDFQLPNGPAAEQAQYVKQLADEICGIDELMRAGASRTDMTAREAMIREAQSKSRTAMKIAYLDQFFTDQLQHRVQIARERIDPEIILKLCGAKAYEVWKVMTVGGLEDLLNEYTVQIDAGSASMIQKMDKMQRYQNLRAGMHEENAASVGFGGPVIYDTVEALDQMARLDGFKNIDRLKVPPPSESAPIGPDGQPLPPPLPEQVPGAVPPPPGLEGAPPLPV